MKVSRNNYEVWMIDYFDGKLNANEIAELMAFIDKHADIKEEFEQFDGLQLEVENIHFDQKKKLHQKPILSVGKINEENYEEFFIAYYENDLEIAQKEDVAEFVKKNPQLEKELKMHGELLLVADNNISYEEKESLKKRPAIGIYWWAGSVAAVMLILFGVFNMLQIIDEPLDREFLTLNGMNPTSNITSISETPAMQLEKENWVVIIPEFETEPIIFERAEIAAIPSKNIYPTLINLRNYSYHYDYTSAQSDIFYASAEQQPEGDKKKNGLLAKIVKNYSNRASARRSAKEDKKENNEPGFVKFLDQSITVFNTITGSDTELVKTYNKEGSLTYYEVEGETISWSKNISANSNSE